MSSIRKIAFIGAGRMARAMATGLIQNNVCPASAIACTSAQDGTGEALAQDLGIAYFPSFEGLLDGADWWILACKPQQLDTLPADTAERSAGAKVLSILAGTPIRRLREVFPHANAIVRAMPNTPGQIRAGTTAWASAKELPKADADQVEAILGALGDVHALDESQLDAVTGLSGSGPAYVFEFIAALRDGGIAEGLSPEVAYALAVQTVKGAAELLQAVPETPETHRTWVSSPGGTTLAGLAVLEKNNFRKIIQDTIQAATHRSKELGAVKP